MTIDAIIVEDEASARDFLERLILEYAPEVKLLYMATSVAEGVEYLKSNKADLVFLDINLRDGNGFELIERLGSINFEVIITTAFDQFALKAIKYSALDYLIKPISPSELRTAIDKTTKKIALNKSARDLNQDNDTVEDDTPNHLLLPSQNGKILVEISKIVRCVADSNYTRFYFTNQKEIMTSKTLKVYEESLGSSGFVRIQKSNLINLHQVKLYIPGSPGHVEMTDGTILKIARSRKKEVLDRLKNL